MLVQLTSSKCTKIQEITIYYPPPPRTTLHPSCSNKTYLDIKRLRKKTKENRITLKHNSMSECNLLEMPQPSLISPAADSFERTCLCIRPLIGRGPLTNQGSSSPIGLGSGCGGGYPPRSLREALGGVFRSASSKQVHTHKHS